MKKYPLTLLLALLWINSFTQKFKEPETRTITLGSIDNKTISGNKIMP